MLCNHLILITHRKTLESKIKNLFSFIGATDQFSYRPSLLNAPDLPPWIHYVYSDRHQTGFLYGVPPQQHGDVEVSVSCYI